MKESLEPEVLIPSTIRTISNFRIATYLSNNMKTLFLTAELKVDLIAGFVWSRDHPTLSYFRRLAFCFPLCDWQLILYTWIIPQTTYWGIGCCHNSKTFLEKNAMNARLSKWRMTNREWQECAANGDMMVNDSLVNGAFWQLMKTHCTTTLLL